MTGLRATSGIFVATWRHWVIACHNSAQDPCPFIKIDIAMVRVKSRNYKSGKRKAAEAGEFRMVCNSLKHVVC